MLVANLEISILESGTDFKRQKNETQTNESLCECLNCCVKGGDPVLIRVYDPSFPAWLYLSDFVGKVHSSKNLQGQFTKRPVLKLYLQHPRHQTAGVDSSLLICVCLGALAARHNKENLILSGDCAFPSAHNRALLCLRLSAKTRLQKSAFILPLL